VREKTSVPVPNILSWSSDADTNVVGADYIIEEVMPGILLQDAWASWDENDDALRIGCIQSIARLVEELCGLDFPTFGSIYFNTSDRPSGAVRIDDTYCIGPHCGRLHSGSSDRSAARLRLLTAPGLQRGPCEY